MTVSLESAAPVSVTASGWGWRHTGRLRWAIRNLDFVIEPAECVLLLGASGAGKSTLIHALAGVLGGDDDGEHEGQLLVDGLPPAASRGRAGLVLQDPDSQVILSTLGNDVAFGCENLGLGRDEIWHRVHESLDAVGLRLPLDHPTSKLSGGQKQRLALAGVLAMHPGLLLLDEPTANLDPDGVADVRDAVQRVLERTSATLVVIEHRVDVWLPVVDRVIVLSANGGVLADGPADAVLANQGRSLSEAGVWVPGYPPAMPKRRSRAESAGPLLLGANGLTVGRNHAVLSNVDLDIQAGTGTVLTGPNGSGKTTLGLTLAGLLPPLDGAVLAAETLRAGAGPHPIRWKSGELLTRIGTVFQEPEHQFLTSTVAEELAIGPRALKLAPPVIGRRVSEMLDRLRLDHLAAVNPFTLSGGEKRRLSVGTVLATSPRVLALDEPTFGLDSRTWQELVALLAELLDAGSAIVAMTHDILFSAALADQEVRL